MKNKNKRYPNQGKKKVMCRWHERMTRLIKLLFFEMAPSSPSQYKLRMFINQGRYYGVRSFYVWEKKVSSRCSFLWGEGATHAIITTKRRPNSSPREITANSQIFDLTGNDSTRYFKEISDYLGLDIFWLGYSGWSRLDRALNHTWY